MREAKAADDLLDSNPETSREDKPLLGVPFTSKEAFQIKGTTIIL